MFFYKQCISFLFFTITVATKQEDKIKENQEKTSKPTIQKRFLEDLDDKEWHISHLRDMEFDIGDDCDEDNFETKAKKYREALKRDAALVDYVSGDPIKDDKQDMTIGKCKQNISNLFKSKAKLSTKSDDKKHTFKNVEENNNASTDGEVKTATVGVKGFIDEPKDVENITHKRRSEYQFSSAEYYDEVPDFDETICPDVVDVITLELDQLRNYDVECEAILEWRSLE